MYNTINASLDACKPSMRILPKEANNEMRSRNILVDTNMNAGYQV
jgi:hypothetical protein